MELTHNRVDFLRAGPAAHAAHRRRDGGGSSAANPPRKLGWKLASSKQHQHQRHSQQPASLGKHQPRPENGDSGAQRGLLPRPAFEPQTHASPHVSEPSSDTRRERLFFSTLQMAQVLWIVGIWRTPCSNLYYILAGHQDRTEPPLLLASCGNNECRCLAPLQAQSALFHTLRTKLDWIRAISWWCEHAFSALTLPDPTVESPCAPPPRLSGPHAAATNYRSPSARVQSTACIAFCRRSPA